MSRPREELDRWQKAVRFAYDLCRYGGRQLRRDRAPQMAAALAFRTLFAFVPVLVLGMVVVKSMRGSEGFLELTFELFSAVGLDDIRMGSDGASVSGNGSTTLSLADWMQGLVREAANVNLAAVGWLGTALISYAALGLMSTIENCFNVIYRAPQSRPWTRRVPMYWFVLTMGPVAIGVMMYVNSSVEQAIESVHAGQTLLWMSGTLWSLFVGWLIMFAVYMLVPNANVTFGSAAFGAAVSSLLIELGKGSLGAYMNNAFAISQLYGSLGLVPVFMFAVYLMWLVVLFGLEVSATLQALHGRDLESMDPKPGATGLLDPTSVIPVMALITERFNSGQSTTARFVAEVGSLPVSTVSLMFDRLLEHKILHSVDGESSCVTLARPPENVSVEELVNVGYKLVDEPAGLRGWTLIQSLRDAQQHLARQTSLAMLVAGES